MRSGAWRAGAYAFLIVYGLVPLSNGADIGYDLMGLVTDTEDRPISGAAVWMSQDRTVRKTETDEGGRFTFLTAKVGPVGVSVFKEGYALGGTGGHIVEPTEVRITLSEPDVIRLRIIDHKYQPVEGARVLALTLGSVIHVPVEDLVPEGFPSVRSGADGFLILDYLPAGGNAGIRIGHRKHAQTSVPTLPVGTELDIALPYGVRLRGRVTDVAGRGVDRARVSVYRVREGKQTVFAEALTDREGFYSTMVPPAPYFVAVRHRSYAIPDPAAVEVGDSEDATYLDVTLPPPHRISGLTVDEKGAPVARVKISYFARGNLFAETLSDVEGRFEVTVSDGKGLLRITPPRGMVTRALADIPISIGERTAFKLTPIALLPMPTVRGQVVVKGQDRPGRVLISTLNVRPPQWYVTDEDGRFSIELEKMPSGKTLGLVAEHGQRFLRRYFKVDLTAKDEVQVRLRSFSPDLSPAPVWAPNKLGGMVAKVAPEIECDAYFNVADGAEEEAFSLRALRGKVVVLTLWGGFDEIGPTRDRIEEIEALSALLEGLDDVAIISVHDAGIEPEEVQEYVSRFGISFPVCCDADPFLTFDIYNTNSIPQTVLIDKRGILRHFHVDGRILELIKDLRRR